MVSIRRGAPALWIALFLTMLVSPASAQDESDRGDELAGIEEITVSITRRTQNLQDVAATISVYDEQTIKNLNIERMADAVALIPNVQIKGNDNDAISIRGISQSFTGQSPVAFHLNGIFQFDPYTFGNLYDVGSIEVQRGPVGVLFGRNATAGAVNVSWNKPTAEWEIFGDVTLGNYDRRQFRGGVNIPLLGEGDERLTARVVVQRQIRDSYVRNLSGTRTDFGRDDWEVRGTVSFQPTEDTRLNVRGYWAKDGQAGASVATPLQSDGAPLVGFFDLEQLGVHDFDPYDGLRRFKQSILTQPGSLSSVLFGLATATTLGQCTPVVTPACPDSSISDTNGALEYHLVNGIVAFGVPPFILDRSFFQDASIPGNSDLVFTSSAWETRPDPSSKGTFVDLDLSHLFQELPLLGDVTLDLSGGFYRREFNFFSEVDSIFLNIVNNFRFDESESWVAELRLKSDGEGPFQWTLGVFWFDRELERDDFTQVPFVVTANSVRLEESGYAPFANVRVKPFEIFSDDPLLDIELFAGIRKNRDRTSDATDAAAAPPLIPDASNSDAKATFRELTYELGVSWFPDEDHTLYLKYSKGYKPGLVEFDSLSAATNAVEEEVVRAWEIGWRSVWQDNTLQMDWTAFYYTYTNLQVPQISGFQVLTDNAASATNWGVELEVRWQPTPEWNIRFAGGYLDATFDEFCAHDDLDFSVNSTTDPSCLAELGAGNLTPHVTGIERRGAALRDLSGFRLEDSPKVKLSMIASYTWDLGEMGSFTPVLEFSWTDDYFRRSFNTDAFDRIDSFTKTDVRLVWRSADERFRIEIFGENLEEDLYYARTITVQIPPVAAQFGDIGHRIYGLRVGFQFGGGN